MNAVSRRGACPTLSAPIQTGDGLLARLNPVAGGLSPNALIGLCQSALRHGNGIVEVTARGSLQIRGLTPSSARQLADEVDQLGIAVRTAVPVETGPLAGLDPSELADPRPLADTIRAAIDAVGLAERLGPKVSVVVDGGGRLTMDAIIADVRLKAQKRCNETVWQLSTGGDAATAAQHGIVFEATACDAVIAILQAVAALGKEARARDLSTIGEIPPVGLISPLEGEMSGRTEGGLSKHFPIGLIPLSNSTLALGIALPFGSMPAGNLIELAQAVLKEGATDIRPSLGRALLFPGLNKEACTRLREAAAALGFVTDPTDPRLHIAACPGTPACASGRIETRAIAEQIAATHAGFLDGSFTLHISGCAKGCAHPSAAAVTVVGHDAGTGLVMSGPAKALSPDSASCDDAAHGLAAIAHLVQASRQPGETTAACLARLGAASIQTAYRQD
jgi:precorrin-3B synthase